MTTAASVSSAIESYINDNWSVTPIAWENAPFEMPETDPWIRVTVVFHDNSNAGLGSSCVLYQGTIAVQIFTRYDTGTGRAIAIADALIALLQNKIIENGIYTFASSIYKVGDAMRQMNRVQTDWYQLNVNTFFETCC